MFKPKNLALSAILLCAVSTNGYGLGPVDGEIGIALWNNDFDADLSSGELDAGSLILHGELWLGERWGIRGAWFDSDLESAEFSNQSRLQAEVRRKIFSASDNNFIALGAGLERIDLINGTDSEGVRISAEGRLGLPGPVFIYGKAAWTPSMQDAGSFQNISATELDTGIHLTPIPFISLRLGYLEYDLDYDNSLLGQGSGSKSSGFYLGAGFHW